MLRELTFPGDTAIFPIRIVLDVYLLDVLFLDITLGGCFTSHLFVFRCHTRDQFLSLVKKPRRLIIGCLVMPHGSQIEALLRII